MEEKPKLVSTEKAKRRCRCWAPKITRGKVKPPLPLVAHKKEVYSDGWSKFTCSVCGKVGFKLVME